MKRVLSALALGVCISACSSQSSPSPTGPSTTIIALSGNMDFGNIQVGSSFTATLDIRNNGNATLTVTGITGPSGYSFSWTNGTIPTGGVQTATIRFSPTEERTYNGTLTVSGNHTSGTNTIPISGTGVQPAGPLQQFGAGQYLVGIDIVAGRYYSDPTNACYWERQSGLGGSSGEIIANAFISFDAGQWIVDILPTDTAFKTDSDCGTWFNSSRRGLQANISPGMWLVGSQVNPGVYRVTAQFGCYWERKLAFTGTPDDIIENNFVSSTGPQLVEVRSGDVGFQSDADCGTWTPTQTLIAPYAHADSPQSRSEIESNLAKQRRKNGRR